MKFKSNSIFEAAQQVLFSELADTISILRRIITHSNDEKFKSFMNKALDSANNSTKIHFIIQDIADHFPNFSGALKSSIPALSNHDALIIKKLSKKYK